MTSLYHYTIQTSDLRMSPREEVGDDAIAALAPMLRSGVHVMPEMTGYRVRVTVDGGALLGTVLVDHESATSGVPLVTLAVAADAASLVAVRQLYAGRDLLADAAVPACVVDVHPSIVVAPDAMGWLGDFERCLAWAWVERRRASS